MVFLGCLVYTAALLLSPFLLTVAGLWPLPQALAVDVVLTMPAFPLAAGPDSLLPLPGRLQLVVGQVLSLLPLLAVAVVLLLLLSLLAAIDVLL